MVYNPPKFYVILSAVGASVGSLFLFKDYMGGKKYTGDEKLNGKVVVITGANSGIGKETAHELARRGGKIIMACRDKVSCEEVRKEIILDTRNKHVYCHECDLSSLASIKKFSEKLCKEENSINYLINNAGVMRCPRLLTKDGFEMQLGVNHLGHFYLTYLLLDKLKASPPSRIINVSSIAHKRGTINFSDLNSEKSYDAGAAYNQSKLANILFTKELAAKLQGTGVTANALHPGIVYTNIGRHMGIQKSYISSLILSPFLWLFLKTPKQGAQTTIYCTLAPELEKCSGKYFSNCQEQESSPEAQDEEMARRLWAVSEKWTRVK